MIVSVNDIHIGIVQSVFFQRFDEGEVKHAEVRHVTETEASDRMERSIVIDVVFEYAMYVIDVYTLKICGVRLEYILVSVGQLKNV